MLLRMHTVSKNELNRMDVTRSTSKTPPLLGDLENKSGSSLYFYLQSSWIVEVQSMIRFFSPLIFNFFFLVSQKDSLAKIFDRSLWKMSLNCYFTNFFNACEIAATFLIKDCTEEGTRCIACIQSLSPSTGECLNTFTNGLVLIKRAFPCQVLAYCLLYDECN